MLVYLCDWCVAEIKPAEFARQTGPNYTKCGYCVECMEYAPCLEFEVEMEINNGCVH